jgi:co-chaperonin GroES (HSP10)
MKVTNNFVFVIRDKSETEKNGYALPSGGKIKPHTGTVVGAGSQVKDPEIKRGKGKKCMFHGTVGFEIGYDGIDYLVLTGDEIICML